MCEPGRSCSNKVRTTTHAISRKNTFKDRRSQKSFRPRLGSRRYIERCGSIGAGVVGAWCPAYPAAQNRTFLHMCCGGAAMTVHFIGAGPGAADLLTLRGRDLIQRSSVCLYAGSLVPKEVIAHAPHGARIIDSAEMTLDEIISEIAKAHKENLDVARIHSGDLSIWSTMAEQIRRLVHLG